VNRKHVTGKLKKFKESGTKESHSINSLKNTLSTLEHDMENGRVELADLEQRLVVARAELEQISDGLRGKTDQFTAQIEEKQKELAPWKQKISAHQSKLEIAQTELNVLNDKFNVSGKHLEQAKHELRRLREMRIGKARFAESKVEELAVLGEQLEESDRGIQKSEGRFQVLRDTLSDARRKEEEAKTALSATESQGKVLKAILQQRDNGSISGIYGRLGSLGTISEKYDVAISSSCGGGLDNIVVQTVRAGQQCVEYLRKHNVGRARFVILETLRQFNLNPIQTPENAPRLFDLVKSSDPKFLPAFYHAMSDTLVAKDMDQARRIAYGRRRHRVVTLDGNVLETSGTMSGGGNRVARGAMSSKPIQGDVTMHGVAKLTAARESAELDYNEHHAALRKAQEKHTKLQRQYDDLESLLPRLEIELKSVDDQVQMAKKRARDLQEAQGKPGEADMALKAKIDAKIEKEQRSMAELHEQ
ncbi:Structural maintenance of chromosomes protein 4, partial [Linderina macrospora]